MFTRRRSIPRRRHLGLELLVDLVIAITVAAALSGGAIAEEDGVATDAEAARKQLIDQVVAHIEKVEALRRSQPDQFHAPEFPDGKDWFNSPPLRFDRDLRGKITILDFWTYCCINCIHVLPELEELETKYAGYPIAVVGVHSAKFENERDSENIRQAVHRYEIRHPVINDDEMFMWKQLGVRSWPTLVGIGPEGNVLLMQSGEGNGPVFEAFIEAALKFYPPEAFRHAPLPTSESGAASSTASPLSFPGKLAVDGETKRLFISDSNHNRIVITDLDGQFVDVVGSGRMGLDDGDYRNATFNRLQGLAVDGTHLFVADAENHALRRVDLEARSVETLVGDGRQGRDYTGGGTGRTQRLSTPWDVVVHERQVFIAMAGTHQLWVYDIENDVCRNYSGTGREQNLNDADPLQAAWSQPSGFAIGAGWLFVADSESSAIRGVKLDGGGTKTFVGGKDSEPRNLFAFGDQDGIGDRARLQHPLGVLWLASRSQVLVADTYNHRLKLMKHESREVATAFGSGKRGLTDGKGLEAQFSEPSGFALHPDGQHVYVADTNNHLVRLVDLESGLVKTLSLTNVPAPASRIPPRTRRLADLPGTVEVAAKPLRLTSGSRGEIHLRLALPDGYHYTKEATSEWQVLREARSVVVVEEASARGVLPHEAGTIVIPVQAQDEKGRSALRVEAVAYFCKDDGVCLVGAVIVNVAMEVGEGGASKVEVEHTFVDVSRAITQPALRLNK